MPPVSSPGDEVVVVGAGIAGAACAAALAGAGVAVRVVDRGRRPGGRMAVRTLDLPGGGRHPVDTGAAYLTARHEAFGAVVAQWRERGLLVPWTESFAVAGPDGVRRTTSGPLRWSAPGGLRSLVEDLFAALPDVPVASGTDVAAVTAPGGVPHVDGRPAGAVVLAMPDPQALRLLAGDGLAAERAALDGRGWEPVVTVLARWARRWWPALDAAFVEDHPLLSLVADDGRRRGDDEPVLVAHTTAAAAREHLADPDGAVGPVLAALPAVLGAAADDVPLPETVGTQRWTYARPARGRDEPFHLGDALVGLCGDGWGERSRVELAWSSGHRVGLELASRLA